MALKTFSFRGSPKVLLKFLRGIPARDEGWACLVVIQVANNKLFLIADE